MFKENLKQKYLFSSVYLSRMKYIQKKLFIFVNKYFIGLYKAPDRLRTIPLL